MKNNIKEMRKSLGMTQKDLADKVGVTRQTILAIEQDKYDPTLQLAFKIAIFFNTTVDELFNYTE
ncbi:helix-turn-helix transcriptional regulator [Facklamia lactis]|uniref:helix-turn-helix transcriptional regulator n=1 Tax=Facklamia lactis TaxID=2749967 RepID=UPI0018CDEBD4|nr:helix-turn-helix transcriptional regulator [Facklamia lactis]MBG9979420.1 helix-turn-helix transcriptional regulator [Facklamia lactis]